ncbi:Protein dopey [Verticillium dahliae VDG1]|nr:Protein dopey [Verticillium dahliae VDG1]
MSNFNNTAAPVPGATGYDDPAGTHGPHHSRIGNAIDPRVDSDRDGRAATNASVPATGHENQIPRYENQPVGNRSVTGYNDPTGTHGPHATRAGNGVSSGTTTTHGPGGISHGPTSAAAGTTAGTATGTHATVDDGHKKGGLKEGVKGVIAQGHGMGESVRGHFNAGVDGLLGDKEGQRKDAAVAAGGEREFARKDFEHKGTMDKSLGPGPNH